MKSHPEQPRYIYTFPFHKTVLIKKAKYERNIKQKGQKNK